MKEKPLKARGIRFSEDQWKKINKKAKLDKSKRTKPSDVVRDCVDEVLKNE